METATGQNDPASNAGSTASGLTDELMRKLSLREAQPQSPTGVADQRDVARHPRLFFEERYDAGVDDQDEKQNDNSLVLKWRQKEKLKTTAVALVLCLNIGVDPPDVVKISPCARLECWVDPNSMQPAKALEAIGKNLQAQYERWQPKAKYKMHLDPTVEDVKKLAQGSRRNAKNERVLFHYNGHGVPRPTANGELWVFNARYTQYIPLSVYELQSWLGTPAIYVLDCSAAGIVINSFRQLMGQRALEMRNMAQQQQQQAGLGSSASGVANGASSPVDPMREIIVLAACAAHEVLPQSPELPADVFTACLTTPIKVALRWFAGRSLLRHDGITKELIDKIPGRQTDRKTPLGELNWIFTAITDTIAWNVLPRALFQKLFRSDLLVASLFRNFLLAERILAAAGCTPQSLPRLPPTHQHPMWQAWDMAAEMCLMQLPTLLSDPSAEFQPSPFFSEQLTAFELWLAAGSRDRSPPEQLPIVLQVLLSQVHRLRALVLLGRFLDMGSWAVDLALSVGIFPYVLKLLQTTSQDLRMTLVFIWAKILALDKSCQVDLIKDNGHIYFIKYLDSNEPSVDNTSRAQAAFVLSVICDGHPKGQALCVSNGLLPVIMKLLRSFFPLQVSWPNSSYVLLLKWLCLCLGKLCQDSPEISLMAIREGAADLLVTLINVAQPEVRAAAVFGLGCLVHAPGPPNGTTELPPGHMLGQPLEDRLPAEQLIANAVRQVAYDPSVLVRAELAVVYARYARGHAIHVQEALALQQRRLQEFARQHAAPAAQGPSSGLSIADGHAGAHDVSASADIPSAFHRSSRAASDHASNQSSGAGNSTLGSGSAGADRLAGGVSAANSLERPNSAPLPPMSSGGAPSVNSNAASNAQNKQVLSIYTAMVESIQLLALDPSPKVAKLGRQVLKLAQYELSFVPGLGVPPLPVSQHAQQAAQLAGAPQSPHHQSASTGTFGSLAQKLRRPVSNWVTGTSGKATSQPSSTTNVQGNVARPVSTTPAATPLAAQSQGSSLQPGDAAALPTLMDMHGHSAAATSGNQAQQGGGSQPPSMTNVGQQAQHGAVQQLSIPSTPSRSSSPASPTKDMGFSRPPYLLICKYEPDSYPYQRAPYVYSGPPASNTSNTTSGNANFVTPGSPSHLSHQYSNASSVLGMAGYNSQQGVHTTVQQQQQAAGYGMPGVAQQNSAGGIPASGRSGSMSASQLVVPPEMTGLAPGLLGSGALSPTGHTPAGLAAVYSMEPLPGSRIYKMSGDAFARPLLDPGTNTWREGSGSTSSSWAPNAAPLDPKRRAQRLELISNQAAKTRQLTQPKLREQVFSVDTGGDGVAKVCFHPYHKLLMCADSWGYIRVMAYDTPAASKNLLQAFHASNGAAPGDSTVLPTTITHMQHITEADGPMLLTGAADGAVRVWRGHTVNGGQASMATAMQAVTIHLPPGPGRSCCYAWHGPRCQLYAAGGSHPDLVYVWDMHHEMCCNMLSMGVSSTSTSGASPFVDSIHLGLADPHLLLAQCSDATLRLLDVRAPRGPALVLAPFKSQIAGVALEPAGRPGMIVAASEKGELVLLDSRAALNVSASAMALGTPPPGLSELSAAATVKAVAAHSKGGVSCLVSHNLAPLIATGTTNQVVKVWTDQCEPVGAIRAQTLGLPTATAAAGKVSEVSCMAWHNYLPLLAAGGHDGIATVYAIDQAPGGKSSLSGNTAFA